MGPEGKKRGASQLVKREYTINLGKALDGCTFKKCAPRAIKAVRTGSRETEQTGRAGGVGARRAVGRRRRLRRVELDRTRCHACAAEHWTVASARPPCAVARRQESAGPGEGSHS